jgi:hypothetical protein
MLPVFSLFAVKTLGAACAASPIINADIADATTPSSSAGVLSLSALQSMAATGANFGTKDIVGIAAAKQAALHAAMANMATSAAASGGNLQEIHRSAAEGSSGGSGSGSGSGGSDKKIAPTAEEWVCLATISHVEVSKRACMACWARILFFPVANIYISFLASCATFDTPNGFFAMVHFSRTDWRWRRQWERATKLWPG